MSSPRFFLNLLFYIEYYFINSNISKPHRTVFVCGLRGGGGFFSFIVVGDHLSPQCIRHVCISAYGSISSW